MKKRKNDGMELMRIWQKNFEKSVRALAFE